jgi:hypothetical protein
MKLVSSYPKMKEEIIRGYFLKNGLEVPEEYIIFLSLNNGGYFKTESEYVDCDDEFRILIDCFYGISESDTTISLFARRGFLKDSLPSQLLSIAEDGIGNEICLGVEGSYFGKVYFWSKEGETPSDVVPTFENVELVSESWTKFISSIRAVV